MRRVFVPILVAYACVAFGCSIEPVTCKNDTWACVVSETSEVLSLCVEGAYEPKADPCMAPTPACDVAALKCVAEKVKCKDSCKNGMLAICEDEDTARVTDCAKNGQVCGYDSTKSSYSCVDKVKACDPEKEIYLVDANECACDKRNHWVGEPEACVCEKDYVAVKGNGGMLECEKKVICNSNEIYFEKTNRCECDTARDWGGTAGNCKCQGEKCEEEKVVTCDKSCVSGCHSDGKCKCKDACADDCNDDGSCKNECPNICKHGCEDDSNQCKCDESCQGNCKEDGSCKETSACPENCKHGCEDDSKQCKCDESCPGNCKADGSCKETSSCPENCKHGCEVDSDQCKCDESCPGNCKEDGSCKETSTCPENCVNGCEDNSNQCKCPKACSTECDKDGKCLVPGDANANHMLDTYETAPKQGQSCRTYADCDSVEGAGDGFCDSFIGYKCSTRCTKNEQCVSDDYICRKDGDGRCVPKVFETVWNVSEDYSLHVSFERGGDVCDYSIDWGDGTTEQVTDCYSSDSPYHEYAKTGEYHVKITGKYLGWKCESCEKLTEVVSFGYVALNKEFAFSNADNLKKVSQIDIPDATYLVLKGMFNYCTSFNDDIDNWDVSSVKDMDQTFQNARSFSQSLGSWDTSKVETMRSMFNQAVNFGKIDSDSLINNWDVSKVEDMREMFHEASAFNNPLNKWIVSRVDKMDQMFQDAVSFNQSLNGWTVSNVKSMSSMFEGATSFNSPLDEWKVSNVTDMHSMFKNATKFDSPLNDWNVSNVKKMNEMFSGATSFNRPLDNWKVSSVETMNDMFNGATSFNSVLDDWELSKIENMSDMFKNAKSFNQSINSWKLRPKKGDGNDKNIVLYEMFFGASLYNQPMNNWDTSSVTNFAYMFQDAENFRQDLSDWIISDEAEVTNIFLNSGMGSKTSNGQLYYCDMKKKENWSKFSAEELGLDGVTCN